MYREIIQNLLNWKQETKKKPLVIHGARQVGKTWIMKKFGEDYYDNYVYVNFERNKSIKAVFDLDLDPERIIRYLEIEYKTHISAENTLIIFDEVQEAPLALTSLKYFCESKITYNIIAAGSLLGLSLHEGTSFPVGKVSFLQMYPLSFKEFLIATDNANYLQLIKDNIIKGNQIIFHEKIIELLKFYYIVGGMPEAVQEYINSKDIQKVRSIQKQLLTFYENDFSKHVPKKDVPRIKMVWNSIFLQLAKENKKFIFGVLKEGSRGKDYELALRWLQDTGLIRLCYNIKVPNLPLNAYKILNIYKIYMLDIGLLGAQANIEPATLLHRNNAFKDYMGAFSEQYVSQELTALNKDLYYYSNKTSTAEIDFLLQSKNNVVPLEVKSTINLKAKSLKVYCEKFNPDLCLRASLENFKKEEWLTNIPLYALSSYLKLAY